MFAVDHACAWCSLDWSSAHWSNIERPLLFFFKSKKIMYGWLDRPTRKREMRVSGRSRFLWVWLTDKKKKWSAVSSWFLALNLKQGKEDDNDGYDQVNTLNFGRKANQITRKLGSRWRFCKIHHFSWNESNKGSSFPRDRQPPFRFERILKGAVNNCLRICEVFHQRKFFSCLVLVVLLCCFVFILVSNFWSRA